MKGIIQKRAVLENDEMTKTYIDPNSEKHWKVVNVTRIIRIRKTTTTTTTKKLDHIVDYKPPGKNIKQRPDEEQLDTKMKQEGKVNLFNICTLKYTA